MQLQSANNTSRLDNEIIKATARLELQAANNTSAIQLEALRNRSDILREMEECCCELKKEIIQTSDSVKDAISANENARLREQLLNASNRNLIFEATRSSRSRSNSRH